MTECFLSFFFCGVVVFAAMGKHSWPTAVTSWEDTVKFVQLLFGTDVQYENYSDRVPVSSNESFLYVFVVCQGGVQSV